MLPTLNFQFSDITSMLSSTVCPPQNCLKTVFRIKKFIGSFNLKANTVNDFPILTKKEFDIPLLQQKPTSKLIKATLKWNNSQIQKRLSKKVFHLKFFG